MIKITEILLLAAALLTASSTAAAAALQLFSPAFKDGGNIPAVYARPAAGGDNVSIPLKWNGAPEGTKIIRTHYSGPAPGCQKMGALDGDRYSSAGNFPCRRRFR